MNTIRDYTAHSGTTDKTFPAVPIIKACSDKTMNTSSDSTHPLNRALLVPLVLMAIAVLTLTSYTRNRIWHDAMTSWWDTAMKSPNKARPNYELGLAYAKKSDFANAQTYLAKAKQLDASFFKKAMAPEDVLRAMNGPDQAIAEYKRLLETNPGQPQMHNRLGAAYYEKGQLVEAKAEFLEAIRLNPAFAEAHSNLGFIYYKMGYNDGAVSEYRIAIALAPTDPVPHIKLGAALANMNLLVDAAQEVKKGLELNPDDQSAKKLLELLNQAIKKKYHY